MADQPQHSQFDFDDKPARARVLFFVWAFIGILAAAWIWVIGEAASNSGQVSHSLFFGLFPRAAGFLVGILKNAGGEGYDLIPGYLVVVGSMVILAVAAGLAQRGVWYGVLIDDRNRISLSRTQQIVWSILLLGALATVAWFNAAIGPQTDSSGKVTSVFPDMDWQLWAALGIAAIGTPLASAAIKQVKDEKAAALPGDGQSPPAPAQLIQAAPIQRNDTTRKASWMDLISGETEGSENSLDISRLQHLMISGMLAAGYGVAIFHGLSDISIHAPILKSMPNPGDSFFWLFGLSSAGYLTGQARSGAVEQPPKKPEDLGAENGKERKAEGAPVGEKKTGADKTEKE